MNINDKFGSLTFIGMSELKKDGRRTGNFKCDCGKLHTTTLRNVLTGKTKSCGCQRKVGLNPHNRTIHVSYSPKRTFGHFHAQLKESAKRKNLKISISTSDLKKLVLSPCFYCGNKHDVPIGQCSSCMYCLQQNEAKYVSLPIHISYRINTQCPGKTR